MNFLRHRKPSPERVRSLMKKTISAINITSADSIILYDTAKKSFENMRNDFMKETRKVAEAFRNQIMEYVLMISIYLLLFFQLFLIYIQTVYNSMFLEVNQMTSNFLPSRLLLTPCMSIMSKMLSRRRWQSLTDLFSRQSHMVQSLELSNHSCRIWWQWPYVYIWKQH